MKILLLFIIVAGGSYVYDELPDTYEKKQPACNKVCVKKQVVNNCNNSRRQTNRAAVPNLLGV
jgi:hypothetical protein